VRTCVSERLKLAQQSVGLCDVEAFVREGEKLPKFLVRRERGRGKATRNGRER